MGDECPFVVGARVAVKTSVGWREDHILKVHKSGNFTLKSTPKQQWRPWFRHDYGQPVGYWKASQTGSAYYRSDLRIWDAATEAAVAEETATAVRRKRWQMVVDRIDHIQFGRVTDAMLDQIEAAIAPAPTKPEEA